MSRKTVIYQMLPRLWGDGRFGSVDDITLNYLSDLGITHIWYTGIIRHSTAQPFVKGTPGSPYAISDYWDVNPYLADNTDDRMAEFESLLERTHAHSLKALMDFVPNHVGRDYSDSHGGIPHFDWHDYDWSDTLKIDYSHPDTWETMYSIVRFWAGKGVDGFRCDMVELVDSEFFRWLIARIKAEFPHVIFVAEVYQKDKYFLYIDHVGFDLLYDKSGLYDTLRAIVAGNGSARGITWNWQFLGAMQPHMLNFLENHDEQRLASSWFAGRTDHFAGLYTSLCFNTAPFMLYAGQEIGIDAAEGHEGRTSIFDFVHPAALVRLWHYVHSSAGGAGCAAEGLCETECQTLDAYRRALALASTDCIGSGLTYDLCYCQGAAGGFNQDAHFAFLRHSGDRTLLFVANFSAAPADLTIHIPHHAADYLGYALPQSVSVSVPPFGCTVVDGPSSSS